MLLHIIIKYIHYMYYNENSQFLQNFEYILFTSFARILLQIRIIKTIRYFTYLIRTWKF